MIEPLFLMDSRTYLRPVAAEVVLHVPGVALVMRDGSRVPIASLDQLTDDAAAIDFPPEPERWAPAIQRKPVGYRRTVRGGGLLWDQFWVFYLHNPKQYAGFGSHEGDWEMVQIGSVEKGAVLDDFSRVPLPVPVCMSFSQHKGAQGVMWWNVKRTEVGYPWPLSDTGGRALAWVALGSQANYPRQLLHPEGHARDVADGGVPLDIIEWREFGPWAHWKGRWGHSETSPVSPARRMVWTGPHLYHQRALL